MQTQNCYHLNFGLSACLISIFFYHLPVLSLPPCSPTTSLVFFYLSILTYHLFILLSPSSHAPNIFMFSYHHLLPLVPPSPSTFLYLLCPSSPTTFSFTSLFSYHLSVLFLPPVLLLPPSSVTIFLSLVPPPLLLSPSSPTSLFRLFTLNSL